MIDDTVLADFQRAGRDAVTLGLVPPVFGNASLWTPDQLIITRQGARFDRLERSDIAVIERSTIPPLAPPARDILIHRAIYLSASATAVLHLQPAHAIALSFSGSMYEPDDNEHRQVLGRIPIVSARRNIVDAVAARMAESELVIVAGHGSYARGRTLDDCLILTASLEAAARISWLRRALPIQAGQASL